jgi:hypothetical protein
VGLVEARSFTRTSPAVRVASDVAMALASTGPASVDPGSIVMASGSGAGTRGGVDAAGLPVALGAEGGGGSQGR